MKFKTQDNKCVKFEFKYSLKMIQYIRLNCKFKVSIYVRYCMNEKFYCVSVFNYDKQEYIRFIQFDFEKQANRKYELYCKVFINH